MSRQGGAAATPELPDREYLRVRPGDGGDLLAGDEAVVEPALVPGWWQGIFQWWRSDWTLLTVYDIPRAVVRCCRLRIPAMTTSG
jgi:hypothetical protein